MSPLLPLIALLGAAVLSGGPGSTPVPETTRQLVVVTTPGWEATTGTLRRFERAGEGWRPVGAPVEVVVGRSGLGWGRGLHDLPPDASAPVKAEGDGRAPAGVFRLSAAFGYAESEATGLPYLQARPGVQCVDDRRSASYNLVLDSTATDAPADWRSKEQMRRRDGLYRIGVIVAHNGPGVDAAVLPASAELAEAEPQPGAGSCIFLHVWRGPGSTTAGCTAMPDPALQEVLAWLNAEADPVLVQLPQAEADRRREAWGLPE